MEQLFPAQEKGGGTFKVTLVITLTGCYEQRQPAPSLRAISICALAISGRAMRSPDNTGS